MMIRTSIIILCYNGLEETTRPCLESVVANTSGDYELIIIDNASTDGTQTYLIKFAKRHKHVQIQLNETNRGFAGGNNDGIKLACGEYIVLLNNDTLVPAGWLDRLLQRFDDHPEIGLIGPVTNSAGNEQRIELEGLNERTFERIAGDYINRQKGVWFSTEKIGFFCVAIRKDVIDKIGLLDEAFGIGMFEDDDYCLRAKRAGYTLAVVEDCFVYHKGSASFLKLSVEKYQTLFSGNRIYFRAKHGIEWSFSDLAFSYLKMIERDTAALQAYSDTISPDLERIIVRLNNFQHLLVQVHQAEINGCSGNNTVRRTGRQVRNAFWQSRLKQFYTSFVCGTYNEKRHYIRLVSRWFLRKFNWRQTSPETAKIIEELFAIRNLYKDWAVIIFPATIDFSYMMQRPQQLAKAFAEKGYLVIYGTLNHQSDQVVVSEKVDENLYLVHESHFKMLRHVFDPENAIFYCLWPNNRKHIEYLPHSYLIYDFMDDLSLLDLPKEDLAIDHKQMLTLADLITVSADLLMDKIPRPYRSKTLLINNAVSDEFINAVNICDGNPEELHRCGNDPVIGYYGAIAKWFDFDLVEMVADALPAVYVVLIGPIDISVKSRAETIVKNHPNVIVLPQRPQLSLVPFLNRFDICLIPFLKTNITDAVSPVKLFEYFSAGKPVVSTDLDECRKHTQVMCTKSSVEVVKTIKNLLDHKLSDIQTEKLKDFAKVNTWSHRVDDIISKIHPKKKMAN